MAETQAAAGGSTPQPVTADTRREQVAKEYSKYVATEPIDTPNGARAFNPGDPIPTSTVEGDHDEAAWLTKDHPGVGLAAKQKG